MELELKPLNLEGVSESRPIVMSGPCSAETEEQVMKTALELAKNSVRIFRAGVWKPRTKPGCFEGNGEKALPWLEEVKKETGMLTTTEVATSAHVEAALRHGVDILWVGARTTANPFAVQDIADALKGLDVPVLVKNPVNPDLELWIGALERINNAGIKRIGVIHRGFSTYEKKLYRNMPMWHIPIELSRRIPQLPIFCDPSHMGGRRDLIAPICQEAMDLGFDGLMIESHCAPDAAWSDAKQQITPDVIGFILSHLIIRSTTTTSDNLITLRHHIDEIDDDLIDLLTKRMHIGREIALYKKEHNKTVVQTHRYNEIIDKRGAQGILHGLSGDFVKKVFEAIHEESVRQQLETINKP
ncbi:MAG: bifunctional 3-deoxy-7-phosphoheptulonate synthase/chorismate mutase type II [Bacteroidaceae bacterium]|nr:bifunctional 3-deoxy-7-phosphoheptulonate synthase/chorismate mutase type II [Bacteroidaceae bacterium]